VCVCVRACMHALVLVSILSISYLPEQSKTRDILAGVMYLLEYLFLY